MADLDETPAIETDSASGISPRYRRMPVVVWFLTVPIWPAGVWIVMAAAKVMRWWECLIAIAASYGLCGGFGILMAELEGREVPVQVPTGAALIGGVLLCAIGYAQYRIGHRRGYWSDQARRVWRILAVTVAILLPLSLVAHALLLHVSLSVR